jgi:ATPase subunit of ABC transporter with duplicated ATPase domains
MGFEKLLKQTDEKIAAKEAGLDLRPVTTKEIQSHLDDFGLAQEFGTYGKIRGLSGGQKVKLVLAAAMWNCPHLLVLDEPTNYLDRGTCLIVWVFILLFFISNPGKLRFALQRLSVPCPLPSMSGVGPC